MVLTVLSFLGSLMVILIVCLVLVDDLLVLSGVCCTLEWCFVAGSHSSLLLGFLQQSIKSAKAENTIIHVLFSFSFG